MNNLNYNTFSKIRSKKELYKGKKLIFSKDKPLLKMNYLHHIFINLDKIELLDDENLPIFEKNDLGLDGFMLASFNKNYNALEYLIKKYPKYIYNTNEENNNWIHYISSIDFLKKLYYDKKVKLDWKKLLFMKNKLNDSTIEFIFLSNDTIFIKELLKNFVYENSKENNDHLFALFSNYFFDDNQIIEILKSFIKYKANLNTSLKYKLPVTFPLLPRENFNILNILLKEKENNNNGIYGYVPHSGGSHSIFYLLNKNGNIKFIEKYFNLFFNFLDLDNVNLNNDNMLMALIIYHANDDIYSHNIYEKLFKYYHEKKMMNQINNYKNTILHLIVQFPFNEFKKYHKYIDFEFCNIRDKFDLLPIDYTNDKKWEKKLEKINENKDLNKDKLNLINSEKTHGTLFKAFFEDISLYFYFLKNKYPRLFIPNTKIKTLNKDLVFDGIDYPAPLLENTFDIPWVIIYQNENNYFIHPYLDLIIKSAIQTKKYDYSCLLVSIKNMYGGLHATPLFIDFKNKKVIRWDSFGYNLKKAELDKVLEKFSNKLNFEYESLKETQNLIGIQEKSMENEKNNMKRGDFGGFCVAWTIWFIEHLIINKNNKISTRKLINKLEKKIISNQKLIIYIRNYSNYLFKAIQNIFKENKWDFDEYTNEFMDKQLESKLYDFILKEL